MKNYLEMLSNTMCEANLVIRKVNIIYYWLAMDIEAVSSEFL